MEKPTTGLPPFAIDLERHIYRQRDSRYDCRLRRTWALFVDIGLCRLNDFFRCDHAVARDHYVDSPGPLAKRVDICLAHARYRFRPPAIVGGGAAAGRALHVVKQPGQKRGVTFGIRAAGDRGRADGLNPGRRLHKRHRAVNQIGHNSGGGGGAGCGQSPFFPHGGLFRRQVKRAVGAFQACPGRQDDARRAGERRSSRRRHGDLADDAAQARMCLKILGIGGIGQKLAGKPRLIVVKPFYG